MSFSVQEPADKLCDRTYPGIKTITDGGIICS